MGDVGVVEIDDWEDVWMMMIISMMIIIIIIIIIIHLFIVHLMVVLGFSARKSSFCSHLKSAFAFQKTSEASIDFLKNAGSETRTFKGSPPASRQGMASAGNVISAAKRCRRIFFCFSVFVNLHT